MRKKIFKASKSLLERILSYKHQKLPSPKFANDIFEASSKLYQKYNVFNYYD